MYRFKSVTKKCRIQLDTRRYATNTYCMAQTFLIFDFGKDEAAAQQARHRIDGWRQGFRLDKKLQLKFDRTDGEPGKGTEKTTSIAQKSSKTKAAAKDKSET